MSNALPSDVQAWTEAHRRQTPDEQWQNLVQAAWTRSRAASSAGNAAEELRWLQRAYRLLPDDGTVALALANASMQAGQLSEAAGLFENVGRRYALSEAWAGLAACTRLLGDTKRSVLATAAALRTSVPTPTLQALAAAVAHTAGLPGWCGLDGDGRVHVGMARKVQFRLDGAAVRPAWSGGKAKLPAGWRAANVLDVDCDGTPCLGSPLGIAAIIAVEGVVEARDCGLQGWAWHPADPERDPVLTVGGRIVTVTAPAVDVVLDRPLARPRRFTLSANSIAQDGATSVLTLAGRHLLGSPIDPAMETRTAAALARAVQFSMAAPSHAAILADAAMPQAARPAVRPRPVDVVVPAYRGRAQTLACLDSVLATVPRGTRVWVIDDASPEPDLVAALESLARRKRIRLVRRFSRRGERRAAGLRAPRRRAVEQ